MTTTTKKEVKKKKTTAKKRGKFLRSTKQAKKNKHLSINFILLNRAYSMI